MSSRRLLRDRDAPDGPPLRLPRGGSTSTASSSTVDPGIWVLIADDSSAVQLALKRLVRTIGKTILGTSPNVQCVLDGAQAVKSVTQRKYSLVLMDLHMPVMGGVQATKEIRKRFSNTELPVLAVTADSDPDYLLCEGFNDMVEKPVTAPTMRPILEKYLCPAPAPAAEGEAQQRQGQQQEGQREAAAAQQIEIDAAVAETLAVDVSHTLTFQAELSHRPSPPGLQT
mmetsp:Transcript_11491/g.20800  ORF Transcript_11491/g.20800 Transcript_11491/m.20800 type:complete len:227 (-) Transcript_11491:375-1055(-)|eukprot:CAMPEP_0177762480 /NCGR_PEP_ID=MMETSP0491_2-20121128/6367_1 /TAXON_ID=63592 /ORGANISM="Tetraselmis chuii, Strain PLY429" /LENGTH=226 /DNA_ID=CAMNT_0019278537 /DNA_START=233 /DNA_END=913 /DNA_ORIENTATION=+